MVAYYQHNIALWMDGTEALSDGAYRVYHVICQLIYLHDGPITYNPRGLAARSNQRMEVVTRYHIPELLKAGKIAIENGKVTNAKCGKELSKIEDRRRIRTAEPPTTRSAAAQPPLPLRSAAAHVPPPDKPLKSKEVEVSNREENRDSKERKTPAPVARCVSDWPPDYREQFWANYPRKTEKKAAMAKLDAVRKSGIPWSGFLAGLLRHTQAVAGTEDRYIKHPTTWLNRGCWEDEYSQKQGERINGNGRQSGSLIAAIDRLPGIEQSVDHQNPDQGALLSLSHRPVR